jgi:hypothetical protein
MKASDQLRASAALPPEKKPSLHTQRKDILALCLVGEDLENSGCGL